MQAGKNILLVDSVDAERDALQSALEHRGYVVTPSRDSRGGVAAALAVPPAVVVCAEKLKGPDGRAFIRELRKMNGLREVPVLLLSEKPMGERLTMAAEAGANDVFPKRRPVYETCDRIDRMVASVEEFPSNLALANTILILGSRGGSGKTSLAVNLAVRLAQARDDTVVLVDLNLEFGTAAFMLDLPPVLSLVDAVNIPEDEHLDGGLLRHESGLRVLPAPPEPGSSEVLTDPALGALFRRLRSTYGYVIVDARPSYREVMLDLWDSADSLIVVSQPDFISAAVTHSLLAAFQRVGVEFSKIHVVINQIFPKAHVTVEQMRKKLGKTPFWIPYAGDKFAMSINKGKAYVMEHPLDPSARAISSLAELLMATRDNPR